MWAFTKVINLVIRELGHYNHKPKIYCSERFNMNNLVIRKLDNYNFVLAERLDEPNIRNINGNEVVYCFKNLDKYYGTLHYAIRGYFKHLNMPIPALGDALKTIKCTDDLSRYEKLFESDLVELLK